MTSSEADQLNHWKFRENNYFCAFQHLRGRKRIFLQHEAAVSQFCKPYLNQKSIAEKIPSKAEIMALSTGLYSSPSIKPSFVWHHLQKQKKWFAKIPAETVLLDAFLKVDTEIYISNLPAMQQFAFDWAAFLRFMKTEKECIERCLFYIRYRTDFVKRQKFQLDGILVRFPAVQFSSCAKRCRRKDVRFSQWHEFSSFYCHCST